jgi:hypothetical protein
MSGGKGGSWGTRKSTVISLNMRVTDRGKHWLLGWRAHRGMVSITCTAAGGASPARQDKTADKRKELNGM